MIGVIGKPGQAALVEEFFELFKTPWEFYRRGRTYDVVVSTADELPHPVPRLFVSYGSSCKDSDPVRIVSDQHHSGGVIARRDGHLPIYAGLLTFNLDGDATGCVTADVGVVGIGCEVDDSAVLRVGYDLFEEMRFLLSIGQPVERAHIPTLDLHIDMLRQWILAAGIPIVEIPPTPAGHDFAVCLTHDIDFVGIRQHWFDHTMWGFLYRSTIGAVRDLVRGRIPVARLFRMWRAVASLPFIYLGWAKDFWEPFGWYLKIEKDLPATYFLIPFKRQPGEKVPGSRAARRATAYDVTDLQHWTAILMKHGCELGVHGIDAWHSSAKGREELARIASATKGAAVGIRMHWLIQDSTTPLVLDEAGYGYDASVGYNETVGYRSGTTQIYRPLRTKTLLELPLHIQDGALFFSNRLDLSEPEADNHCKALIANAQRLGGVLTVLWHDRSHGPERFWGDFYIGLVRTLKALDPWFGTASQIVGWFRQRREVRFGRSDAANGAGTSVLYSGHAIEPPLRIRVHHAAIGNRLEPLREPPAAYVDIAWNGQTPLDVDRLLSGMSEHPSELPRTELCSL